MADTRLTPENALKAKSGIKLELGGGKDPQPGFFNIDILDLPEVDLIWDLERTPWPLPDNCVLSAISSHVLEHLNPHPGDKRLQPLVQLLVKKKIFTQAEADTELGSPGPGFMNVMDELWRVCKVGARFAFVCPNAESPGMYQDPTHINFINNTTMRYFDPTDESGLYSFYRPKPWRILMCDYEINGNIECILKKLPWDKSYGEIVGPLHSTDEVVQNIGKQVRSY